MKVLVTYLSRTGNTKKVAEAIFEEIQADKDFIELNRAEGFDGYDLVFVGFPIEMFGPPREAASFLGQHCAGKNVALFITHASKEDDPELAPWLDKSSEVVAQANLIGTFHCQGELGEQIANYMEKSPNEKLAAWARERPSTLGQPDRIRLRRAQDWAKKMLETCPQRISP